jgi:hypothetical protein
MAGLSVAEGNNFRHQFWKDEHGALGSSSRLTNFSNIVMNDPYAK